MFEGHIAASGHHFCRSFSTLEKEVGSAGLLETCTSPPGSKFANGSSRHERTGAGQTICRARPEAFPCFLTNSGRSTCKS